MKKLLKIITICMIAFTLTACSNSNTNQTTTTNLYGAFFMDSSEENQDIRTYEFEYEGELTPEKIADGLTNLTGLDFFIGDVAVDGDSVTIDWKMDSTLISNLDDREQKQEFHHHDADSLRWFMLDSLYMSIINNLPYQQVYYTMNGGEALEIEELFPVNKFDLNTPYMGSDFYKNNSAKTGFENPYIGLWELEGDTQLSFAKIEIINISDYDAQELKNVIFIKENMEMIDVGYFEYTGIEGKTADYPINIVSDKGESYAAYFSEDLSVMYITVIDEAYTSGENTELSTFYKRDENQIYNIPTVEEGFAMLEEALGDEAQGKGFVETGEEEIDGNMCRVYAMGTNTEEKFTAEMHYAVSGSGKIYVLDYINGSGWSKYTP